MHDVLRNRLLRKLESLPEEQVYEVLDFIEFLESKYSTAAPPPPSGLQSLAEKLEDELRHRALSPTSLREVFQLLSAADRIVSRAARVGREILHEINGSPKGTEGKGEGEEPRGERGPGDGTR